MATRRVSVTIDADLNGFNRGVLGASANTKKWVSELEQADGRMAAIVQTGLALAPAIAPIGAAAVPAIAGLSTQLGFAAVAGGTALLAFQGVGDALGALNDYQLEPTSENLAKVNEKMEALGPAGEVFVRQLQDMRDEFQGLQDVAQAEMFPGMANGLDSLMTQMPAFERVIGSVASAMGDLAADAGADLAGPEWSEFFDYLESEAGPILEAMGYTIGNLVEGMTNMVMAFDPLSDDFTAGMLSMSEAFVEWSDNLDSSQGFQEFVRYVRESGPQAMDTLGAIAGALVEFVEAAAPVGAVVLPVLEVLADTLAGIADSPAGPAIILTASAIGTLGRSLALLSAVGLRGGDGESKLSRALGVETMKSYPAAVKGVTAANQTLISAQAALATQATKTRDAQFAMIPTADKRKAVQDFAKAQDGVRASSLAVAEAEKVRSSAMRESAAQMGKTAAAIGGLALMSTGAADGLGLTNTVSLAMMGTLAGPWGAAVGAGAGLLLDLEASANIATDAMKNFDTAISADNRTAALDSIETMREELESLAGTDMAGASFSSLSNLFSGTSVQDEIDALTSAIDEAEGEIADLDAAKARSAADKTYYNMLTAETDALEENVSAMRAKRDEALRGSNAMLNYRSALLDVRDAANENSNTLGRNGQILKGQERAGIEAKQSLNDMASAWNGLNDKAQNAPGAFRGAINSFVDAAKQMGVGEDRAREMARAILNIPTKHDTQISMEVDVAMQRAAAIKAELASIDRNIDVYVNIRRPNAGGFGPQAVSTNAYGDIKDRHSPEIAKGGSWRVWAEDETGGESYIPHANDSRRPRAKAILEETASILGAKSVEWYAGGGSSESAAERRRREEERRQRELDAKRAKDLLASDLRNQQQQAELEKRDAERRLRSAKEANRPKSEIRAAQLAVKRENADLADMRDQRAKEAEAERTRIAKEAEAERIRIAEEAAKRQAEIDDAILSGQEKAWDQAASAAEANVDAAKQSLEAVETNMKRLGDSATAAFGGSFFSGGQEQRRGLWVGENLSAAGDWRSQAQQSIAGLEERSALISQLSGQGLTGAALEDLLGNQNNAGIAAMLKAGEIDDYAALFARREMLMQSVGQQAGVAGYGAEYAAASVQMAQMNAQFAALTAAIQAARPITVLEAISAQATAQELARLMQMQGAA